VDRATGRGQTISKKASGEAAEPNLKRQQNGTLHGESRGLLGSKQEENVRGRQGFRKARVRGEGDFRAKGGWGRCLEMGLEGGNERRIEFMLRSDQVQLGKKFWDDFPETPALTEVDGAIGRREEKARQGNRDGTHRDVRGARRA
jgi:hypothetical protein